MFDIHCADEELTGSESMRACQKLLLGNIGQLVPGTCRTESMADAIPAEPVALTTNPIDTAAIRTRLLFAIRIIVTVNEIRR